MDYKRNWQETYACTMIKMVSLPKAHYHVPAIPGQRFVRYRSVGSSREAGERTYGRASCAPCGLTINPISARSSRCAR